MVEIDYTPSMHYFRRQYANRFTDEADVIAAEARFDAALAAHDAEVLRGTLPPGAHQFDTDGAIQHQGVMYFPADYILTRTDIAAIRAEAWDEGRESIALDFTRPLDDAGMRTPTPNPYRKEQR